MAYAAVVKELGSPDRTGLCNWYQEYKENGCFQAKNHSKYSESQKKEVAGYYLGHGKNLPKAACQFGYPSLDLLRNWIREFAGDDALPSYGETGCQMGER